MLYGNSLKNAWLTFNLNRLQEDEQNHKVDILLIRENLQESYSGTMFRLSSLQDEVWKVIESYSWPKPSPLGKEKDFISQELGKIGVREGFHVSFIKIPIVVYEMYILSQYNMVNNFDYYLFFAFHSVFEQIDDGAFNIFKNAHNPHIEKGFVFSIFSELLNIMIEQGYDFENEQNENNFNVLDSMAEMFLNHFLQYDDREFKKILKDKFDPSLSMRNSVSANIQVTHKKLVRLYENADKQYKQSIIHDILSLEFEAVKNRNVLLYRAVFPQNNNIVDFPLEVINKKILTLESAKASLNTSKRVRIHSYGFSLFAGALADQGACTFTISSKLIFVVPLSLAEAKKYFYLPEEYIGYQMWEKGENFHPRLALGNIERMGQFVLGGDAMSAPLENHELVNEYLENIYDRKEYVLFQEKRVYGDAEFKNTVVKFKDIVEYQPKPVESSLSNKGNESISDDGKATNIMYVIIVGVCAGFSLLGISTFVYLRIKKRNDY
ncbi:hypothetical protein ROZALSC1DRAFT_30178, partial [Rozella allomycis CSF55]